MYIDGVIAAVPTANKEAYREHSLAASKIFKEFGAISYVETWGDDVPHGKVTDFYRAVQAADDETVTFAWIGWPDKAFRDSAWEKIMQDERMAKMNPPLDGKRMVYGGFEAIVEA